MSSQFGKIGDAASPNLRAGAVLGAALGVIGLIAIVAPFVQSDRALPPLPYVALAAALNCLPGVVLMGGTMWLAWLLRRPDRDAARSDVAGEFD